MQLDPKPLPYPEPLGLVWGVKNIAHLIGRTPRQTECALVKGELPAARKINGRWCVSRKKLLQYFEEASA